MSSKPIPKYDVRFHVVGERNLLVQANSAYEISEVGLSIWELCDGDHSLEEIAQALVDEYDTEYSQAIEDCQEFVAALIGQGLIQK